MSTKMSLSMFWHCLLFLFFNLQLYRYDFWLLQNNFALCQEKIFLLNVLLHGSYNLGLPTRRCSCSHCCRDSFSGQVCAISRTLGLIIVLLHESYQYADYTYPELFLFHDEDKALIVVRVQVAHFHCTSQPFNRTSFILFFHFFTLQISFLTIYLSYNP